MLVRFASLLSNVIYRRAGTDSGRNKRTSFD